jgi:hypothetical protein
MTANPVQNAIWLWYDGGADAMIQTKVIDVATIEAAFRG